jgi:hypothetical protein
MPTKLALLYTMPSKLKLRQRGVMGLFMKSGCHEKEDRKI